MSSGYTITGEIANQLKDGEEPDGFQILENEFQEEKRWTLVYRVVFRSPNLGVFALYYEVPATEDTEGPPDWEDDDVVNLIPVIPTVRSIIEYVEDK